MFRYLAFSSRTDRAAALRRAVRAAVAAHRPQVVRALLDSQGPRAFADALSGCSGRVAADVLTMLPIAQRACVVQRLPRNFRLMHPVADLQACTILGEGTSMAWGRRRASRAVASLAQGEPLSPQGPGCKSRWWYGPLQCLLPRRLHADAVTFGACQDCRRSSSACIR
jgi:hypothetical protein